MHRPPQTAADLVELLEQSRLISPDQWDHVRALLLSQAFPSAGALAQRLVAEKMLTPYQVSRLLDGVADQFFIGRYRVQDVLGIGGMGTLYLVRSLQTDESYALKVLHAVHCADPGMRLRFELEARAGLRLNHPHIVRTCALAEHEAVPYMVLELVPGLNLQELVVRDGPLPWWQAADVIRQAALGLDYAHAEGLIHRDMKPANLLINSRGEVKILDFGLAMVDDDVSHVDLLLARRYGHTCIGSADYIAPEQIGNPRGVDCRADIYSLGGTLYSIITGKLLFTGDTRTKLRSQMTGRPIPLSQIVPDAPRGLLAVIDRMLEKRRGDRYTSAKEVAEALRPFARREPVAVDFDATLRARARALRRKAASYRDQAPSDAVSSAPAPSATATAD